MEAEFCFKQTRKTRKVQEVNNFKEQVPLGNAVPESLGLEKTKLTLEQGESGFCNCLQKLVSTEGENQFPLQTLHSSTKKPWCFLGMKPTFCICGQSGKMHSSPDLASKSHPLHGAKTTLSGLSFSVSIKGK